MSQETDLFRIVFLNDNKVYELYAKSLSESSLFNFIEIEDIVFGEGGSLVIDPAEERLKLEFAGVKRTYVPIYAILRIDEVSKQGVGKVTEASSKTGNVTQFPRSIFRPRDEDRTE